LASKGSDSEPLAFLSAASSTRSTKPIAIVPLSDCLIKLDKSGHYLEIVLYRSNGQQIFLQNWKPSEQQEHPPPPTLPVGRESRRSWKKGGAFDEYATTFSIRLHRRDESYAREWILTLEAAILLGGAGQDNFSIDEAAVSEEEEEEEEEEKEEEEGEEIDESGEMIEEEEAAESPQHSDSTNQSEEASIVAEGNEMARPRRSWIPPRGSFCRK